VKNWVITGVAFVCTGVLAAAQTLPGFELTGLVDLGALRVACLKSTTGETLTLHPGESALGVRLKEIDVKAGRAILERGTTQIPLRLISGCAHRAADSGPGSGAVLDVRQKTNSDSLPSTGDVEEVTSSRPLKTGEEIHDRGAAGGSSVVAPRFLERPRLDSTAPSGPATTVLEASASAPTTPVESKPVDLVGSPSADSTTGETVTGATQNGAGDRSGGLLSNAGKTEFWHEGERIRALYGDAGLFAWQRDQYLKSLTASRP
jgi:hypothetical protein